MKKYLNEAKKIIALWRHFGFRIAFNHFCGMIAKLKNPVKYGEETAIYRKYRDLIRLLSYQYDAVIRKYENISEKEWNGEVIDANYPIWIWWGQGVDNAPELVKKCVQSIRKNAKAHPVFFLDRSNLANYIVLPNYIYEKYDKGIIQQAMMSDIVRWTLISHYGGIWCDACDYVLTKNAFTSCEGYHFYSVKGHDSRMNITRRLWSDSFFAIGKNNYFAKYMSEVLLEYWKRENYLIDYFLGSCLQNAAYSRIPALRRMFEFYPENNQQFTIIRTAALIGDYQEKWLEEVKKTNSILNLTRNENSVTKKYYNDLFAE